MGGWDTIILALLFWIALLGVPIVILIYVVRLLLRLYNRRKDKI